tara:strand:- start:1713 stop:1907 length:195 start_codon:yes stop_codon:yes gene_type:complete
VRRIDRKKPAGSAAHAGDSGGAVFAFEEDVLGGDVNSEEGEGEAEEEGGGFEVGADGGVHDLRR